MATKLSHSSVNTYLTCGRKYQLHYIEKLRPEEKSGALLFGDAMDNALNTMILKNGNALAKFNEKWLMNRMVSDGIESIPDNKNVRYADSDFDEELLLDEDYKLIQEKSEVLDISEGVSGKDIVEIVMKSKKDVGYPGMELQELQLFNYINWLSLKRKAAIMLSSYEKIVIPKIKKVYEVQKKITIQSADGDEITGFVDLIIDIELSDGKIVKAIMDNKTSTMDYAKDSVMKSQQLGLYCLAENITHGGFIVIKKQITKNRKKICTKCGSDGIKENKKLTTAKTCDNTVDGSRCHGLWDEKIDPSAWIDILVDEVKQHQKDTIINTFDQVNKAIKAELFPSNFGSCGDFGGCPYLDKCFKNSDKGLIKVK